MKTYERTDGCEQDVVEDRPSIEMLALVDSVDIRCIGKKAFG